MVRKEDHPRTCHWLITMVIASPQWVGVVGPFPNGLVLAYKWVTGMIFQVLGGSSQLVSG